MDRREKPLFLFILLLVSAVLLELMFPWRCMATAADADYADMSLEALMDIEITSVSKKTQKISEAAAAVFVITQEDIQRSGATSIPEVLRMAPGVHVAKIDSNKWAVSIRGFNGRFANKLLVLIDGRSVYTLLFSGVFWEVQDLALADVERIEVIRGPGASLWGSNAVNGVINIITKNAHENRGGLVEAIAGTSDSETLVRYEKQINDNTAYRIYTKYKDLDNQVNLNTDTEAEDRWNMFRAGFKVNHDVASADKFNLQGEVYSGNMGETVAISEVSFAGPPYAEISMPSYKNQMKGGHALFKWQRLLSGTSDMQLQLYYDHFEFNPLFIDIIVDTCDLSFQHRFEVTRNQELIWGLGYRCSWDEITALQLAETANPKDTYSLLNLFLQDEISLMEDRVKFIVGSQFERNEFTGWEIQPNARLLWAVSPTRTLWTSVSRAIRTPSRIERGFSLSYAIPNEYGPFKTTAYMDSDFNSESLTAYEMGYRSQIRESFSMDATVFFHNLDDLRGSTPEPPYFDMDAGYLVAPVYVGNSLEADLYGFELAADWNPAENVRLQTAYTYMQMDITHKVPGFVDIGIDGGPEYEEGKNPKHQLSMRLGIDLSENLQSDIWARYSSELKSFHFKDSYELDLSLKYKVTESLDIRLVGQNLLHDHRPEFISEYLSTQPTENMRKGYVGVSCKF